MNKLLINHINLYCPISRASIYQNGTVVLHRARSRQEKRAPKIKRGQVKTLSKQSLSKAVFVVSETFIIFTSVVTVTYGKNVPTDGKAVKKHLHNFLQKIRYHFGSFEYLWWLEFQRRGAPHFHILLTLEANKENRYLLAELWVKATNEYKTPEMLRVHRHKKTFETIRKGDNAKRYLTWYTGKQRQKRVPKNYVNVGRFWGASKAVKNSIPDPVTVPMTDDQIRELYPRLAALPLLPKIIYG